MSSKSGSRGRTSPRASGTQRRSSRCIAPNDCLSTDVEDWIVAPIALSAPGERSAQVHLDLLGTIVAGILLQWSFLPHHGHRFDALRQLFHFHGNGIGIGVGTPIAWFPLSPRSGDHKSAVDILQPIQRQTFHIGQIYLPL